LASCWAIGRNSVDATNAFLIRSAAAEGPLFRLRLAVVLFPLVVAVAFLADEVFEVAAVALALLLDLCVVELEAVFGVSEESDDCERTGTTGSKATKTPTKTRGAGTKNDEKRDFMVSL
jgi:hypothetical protein